MPYLNYRAPHACALVCTLFFSHYATIGAADDGPTIPDLIPESYFTDADKIAPVVGFGSTDMADMLEIWNKRGDQDGMKCVECHSSPNAAELALTGIDASDIERRGAIHHSFEDIQTLIRGNIELAETLRLPANVDREDKFVMQPGDHPVHGNTYWDRDYNWVTVEVPRVTPSIIGSIETIDDAWRVYREFVDNTFDPTDMQFPFVSPVYSGDKHHHSNTGTIHKWITVLPIQPTSAQNASLIEQRRDHYLRYPSNQNFWDYYQAIEYGAGPLGFAVRDYGRDSNTFGRRIPAVDAHPLARDTNAAAANYEMQKYLIGLIAWHDDQQKAFKAAGILDRHFLEDPMTTFKPGFQQAFSVRNRRDARHLNAFLAVGDASGQPIGKGRLKYPESIVRTFLGDEYLGTSSRETEFIVSDHAYLGSIDWWAMTHVYGWSKLFGTAFYWRDDMMNFGQEFTFDWDKQGVTRETSKPGYVSFNTWAALRAAVLQREFNFARHVERAEGNRSLTIDDFIQGLEYDKRQMKSNQNLDGIANEDHARLSKLLTLNTLKTVLLFDIEAQEQSLARGRSAKKSGKNVVTRDQFKLKFFIDWAAEDMPEMAAHLQALMEQMVANQAQLYGAQQDPTPFRGRGDGVRLTTFDDTAFTMQLDSMIVPDVHNLRSNQKAAYDYQFTATTKVSANDTDNIPIARGEQTGMSARWEGFIAPPFTDDYDILFVDAAVERGRANEKSIRVTIDDQIVFDKRPGEVFDGYREGHRELGSQIGDLEEMPVSVFRPDRYLIRLEKGRRYRLTVEVSSPLDDDIHGVLFWAGKELQPMDVIDPEYFYSALDSQRSADDTWPVIVINGNRPIRKTIRAGFVPEAIALSAREDEAFSHRFAADHGNGPLTWSHGGQLPYGMSLSEDGWLTGYAESRPSSETTSPGARKSFPFAVIAKDADGDAAIQYVDFQVEDYAGHDESGAVDGHTDTSDDLPPYPHPTGGGAPITDEADNTVGDNTDSGDLDDAGNPFTHLGAYAVALGGHGAGESLSYVGSTAVVASSGAIDGLDRGVQEDETVFVPLLQSTSGTGEVIVHLDSVINGIAGIMIRESVDARSDMGARLAGDINGDGQTGQFTMQRRPGRQGVARSSDPGSPGWMRVVVEERRILVSSGFERGDSIRWNKTTTIKRFLPETFTIGLAVSNEVSNATTEAVFSQLRVNGFD